MTDSLVLPERKKSFAADYFSSMQFNSLQWLIYALLIIAGLALRWIGLEDKSYHHDESQHAMFGKYAFDWPDHNFYRYNPMLHGPFLYNFYRLVYNCLGNTNWSARVPIALMGSLFIFLPFIFRKYLTRNSVIVLTAAISLSPTLVYWSRFLIHDYFVFCAMLLMLYALTLAPARLKSFYFLLGLAWQLCLKANVYVFMAQLLGFLLFDWLVHCCQFYYEKPAERLTELKAKIFNLNTFTVVLGLVFVLLISYFFASGNKLGFAILCLFWIFVALVAWSSFASKQLISTKIIPLFKLSGVLFAGSLLSIYAMLIIWSISQKKPEIGFFTALYNYSHIGADLSYIFIHIVGVNIFILGTLLLFAILSNFSVYAERMLDNVLKYKAQFYISIFICAVFYAYFYTSGFRYSEGIIDGLYRTGITYWYEHHSMERIQGPFAFHFYMFGIYELPFILAFFFHFYCFIKESPKWTKIIFTLCALAALICVAVIPAANVAQYKLWKFFKLKDNLDVLWLFFIIPYPFFLSLLHVMRGEKFLAFWGYLFSATFFTYSYLGEKVPWLGMYALAMGFVYLVLYFEDYFRRNPIVDLYNYSFAKTLQKCGFWLVLLALFFVIEETVVFRDIFSEKFTATMGSFFSSAGLSEWFVKLKTQVWNNLWFFLFGIFLYFGYKLKSFREFFGSFNLPICLFLLVCMYNLRASIQTNFVYSGSEVELISQVHTTDDFHRVALKIRQEALSRLRGEKLKVLGVDDVVWPLTWYMVDAHEFKFSADPAERPNFDYIFQNFEEEPKNIPEGFEKLKVDLRGWWVPDYNQMTLKKFLDVAINHRPWNSSGFTSVLLLTNTNGKRM